MRFVIPLCVFMIFITLIFGCSGKKVDPVSGDFNPKISGIPSGDMALDLSKWGSRTGPLWIYSGTIDLRRNTAVMNPVRTSGKIGDLFDADITQFLLKNPCATCVRMSGVSMDSTGTRMIIDFQVKHPFADIIKRPDLSVFDVRAILQTSGTQDSWRIASDLNGDGTVSPTELLITGGEFVLNADGYTSHFNTGVSNANIHPFKRFFVNPANGPFDPLNPTGHNVMKVGSDWDTQSFEIDTAKAPDYFDFDLVIDGSYGQSAVFKSRSNPTYFLPAFNRKEAWSVEVQTTSNMLASGNTSSYADLQIAVKDWQAGAYVNANYPNCSANEIPYKSDVKQVVVDIPMVNSNSLDSSSSPSSGTGTDTDPYLFTLRVNNDMSALDGTYYGIVAVRDDLDTMKGPSGIPTGPGGFPEAKPDIRDYTAYCLFEISIGGGGPPPTGDVQISGSNAVFVGETIQLSAQASTDGGTFQWSTTSPEIEFVGGTDGQAVQVKGLTPNTVLNGASVRVDYSTQPAAYAVHNLTCWGVQYIVPTSDYKQYINLEGGGQNGRTTTLQVKVVPDGMGSKQIHWIFTDPDEPIQIASADETSDYESDTNGNDNRGTEDPGFGNNPGGFNPDDYLSNTDQNNKAIAPFTVSSFGGDNYIIKAYPEGMSASLAIESPTITVWRWLDVPAFTMASSSGAPFYYMPDFETVNEIYSGGYIYINATNAAGNLPYNSGGASDGSIPLEGSGYWPVENVPAIGYLLNNSDATEGYHKVNMSGIRRFGTPAPGGVNPLMVLGLAYSYWSTPDPDPFHFMYYNYFFVCTGRIQELYAQPTAAERHVFAHELGHTLGLPHNNIEEGESQHDPFYPDYKWSGGKGIMAATVSSTPLSKFTRAEFDFLRGAYGGPYFY